jgi:integrase
LIFPAPRGGLLSPEGLTAVLRRLKRSETVHGFRSTFRDWASERTNAAHEVAEQALAHAIPNATERAYRRGQLLEKRRVLMGEWAAFLNNLRG